MRHTLHTRAVPIVGGSPQPCPFGAEHHLATTALITGNVRGVHCERHAVAARRDHVRALKQVGGFLAPDDAPVTYVGLVACSSTKTSSARPARELYTSALFRKSVAYLEATCERWYVLSARHGLVHPDTVLEPYNVRLGANDQSSPPVWSWAARVVTELEEALTDVTNPHLVVLAGEQYRTSLTLTHLPHTVPLAGLGIGEQLGWLTTHQHDDSPVPTS